ncbi:MAG TPA: FapA family protein [Chloroflexota bacterium]|nr:FapA family protein [Chloroflexota bacterium]
MTTSPHRTPEGQLSVWQLTQPRISAAEAIFVVPDGWRRFTLVRAVPANEIIARRARKEGDDSCGENLVVNAKGMLLAKKTGAVALNHMGRICLMDLHRFPGLDDHPKTIVLNGSAVIDGPVGPGWCIRASGDVEVRGFVNEATIVAGGSVLVRGDVIGTGSSSMIVAGWDVILNQAADTEILAGHDVAIAQQLLNCNVTADGRILVGNPPMQSGIISGGLVHAGREIALFRAGSTAVFPPELMIGPMPGVTPTEGMDPMAEMADIRQDINNNFRRYESSNTSMHLTQLRQTYRSLWSLWLRERGVLNLTDGRPYIERVVIYGMVAQGAQVTIGSKRFTLGHEINEPRQFVLHGDTIMAEAAVPMEKPATLKPGATAASPQRLAASASNRVRLGVKLPPSLVHELDLADLLTGPGTHPGPDVWNQVQRLEGELRAAEVRGSIRRLLVKNPDTGAPLGYAYRRDDVVRIANSMGIEL